LPEVPGGVGPAEAEAKSHQVAVIDDVRAGRCAVPSGLAT